MSEKPRVDLELARYMINATKPDAPIDLSCDNFVRPLQSHSNDLHEALSHKHGKAFWKCWNSKFERMSKKIQVVDGITDGRLVAENFARHFGAACSNQSDTGARGLAEKCKSLRADYVGSP